MFGTVLAVAGSVTVVGAFLGLRRGDVMGLLASDARAPGWIYLALTGSTAAAGLGLALILIAIGFLGVSGRLSGCLGRS